jgi:hypothetical protein
MRNSSTLLIAGMAIVVLLLVATAGPSDALFGIGESKTGPIVSVSRQINN